MQQHEHAYGYWPVRIMLYLSVMGTILSVGFAIAMALPSPSMGGDHTMAVIGPLTVPQTAIVSLVAAAIAIVGLVWQIRIFRGERIHTPAWRYRDR